MKLEGSLDAFSLPDIFQLLSFTKKSGGLHLQHAGTRGCVYFQNGAVSEATSDEGRQALARRLIALAIVGDDELASAVRRAEAEPGIGVARALLEAGAIDSDTLHAVANEHAVDAVFDFLRWADGDFSFSVDEQGPDHVGISVTVDDVVAQAKSRLESWEQACQMVPSLDAILVVPLAIDDDANLSRAEWALLALVDGRRSVAELVELAGRGDFAVVSALAALVQRNLLAVRGVDDEGAHTLIRRYAVLGSLETAVAPAAQALAALTFDKQDFGSSTFAEGDFDEPDLEAPDLEAPDLEAPDFEASEPFETTDPRVSPFASTSPFARAKAPAFPPRGSDERRPEMRLSKPIGAEPTLASATYEPRLVPDTRASVIPVRPEPFAPLRRPDFPDNARPSTSGPTMMVPRGGGQAAAASALVPQANLPIEHDPSVNKSLLLRLIAGVRGL